MTSDHILIAFELRNGKSNKIEVDPQVPVTRDIFNYNKPNWELFKSHLPNCAPTEIQDDVEKLNNLVINGLLNAANLSIPKKIKNKYFHKSLPNYILLLIKKRKFFRKEIKRGNLS